MTPSESLTTPVVAIAFRRPDMTRRVFDVMRRVKPSEGRAMLWKLEIRVIIDSHRNLRGELMRSIKGIFKDGF
ncbi:hypothetical protein [Lyngbya sp. CCY1209]|jgi:hypothetical protein|uniref:hypothetical protein n=1 Tax=Lyngbya sp. CCY1209 TaxID=2886103 RepID=UPI002D21246E|nr:hypothetical protein [Lyngbya sp. CCY1209]MEB3886340.1 hypothetical protein [Lyngbya sp. CCY1209]